MPGPAVGAELLPLFPLQAVLFPGGLLTLKVFEARYLDLVARCMRSGQGFGVVCLRQGAEVGRSKRPTLFESVGVHAHIDEVDGDQAGILKLRCTGRERFRLEGAPSQQADGLWQCAIGEVEADARELPAAAMFETVKALSNAIATLRERGQLPFVEPFRLDDAGWVANRWCELLPIPLSAKYKLMALEDPAVRLSVVDGYLRDKQVVR
ncbi:MAG: LON peptidase substrate-binding domain-containing protein [Rubrivivax sp.]|jgi:Lon protease-like protein|nr:LON peptidase substrate-binding domain-containing protein [Rubrivivax sp.]MBK7260970.1 LON peptidase substrate-binding domain-containing protein [Rubrivivax sp.]MBK8525902.1 LON peptidase substrate-binding domain-containing protein [Rubrivivax sp.]